MRWHVKECSKLGRELYELKRNPPLKFYEIKNGDWGEQRRINMRFSVIRTTTIDKREKPCECAVLETHDAIEQYYTTEEQFNEYNKRINQPLWKDYGTNHTTFINKNGKSGIQRTIPNRIKNWEIEINTLEELLRFIDNVDEEIVITKNENKILSTPIYTIEIYDYWRE